MNMRWREYVRTGDGRVMEAYLLVSMLLLSMLVMGDGAGPVLAQAPVARAAAAEKKIDFVTDVQPIFATHCISCHGGDKQRSDYRLDQRKSALTGGAIGGAIVAGKSEQSKLLHYVSGHDEEMKMPPKGKGLSAAEISLLRAWIDQGASWPAEAQGASEPVLWSLMPLAKPALPAVKNQAWVRSPIDAFILAKMEGQGMTPAPVAGPRSLIRRVYFDLTGLPPTPEEVDAFVKEVDGDQGGDASAGDARLMAAYSGVVDRLLASPRYGERWARHWMDVVHFAETHGHDQDRPRPTAWPYRDYLIRAFNDDKPYGRFIEDQVAGDVLNADDPWATAALGMLAAGPWDESSQMGIQDGTIDKKVAQYLDRDDMIATTISTFSSMTISCARCHNHKFDPISLEDYYALQAVFAGVDRAERSYEPDLVVRRRREALMAEKAKLDAGRFSDDELSSGELVALVDAWSEAASSQMKTWTALDSTTFASARGATLTKQADGSILSGGKRPEKDTYTITATTTLKSITAIRLDVLTDDSLPIKGPGRQDNGNLHLSEFRIDLKAKEGLSKSLKIRSATADWDQDGWGIARAIDGNPASAWGIFPKVSEPHFAIFELAEAANVEGEEVTLTFTLDQVHGEGHLIGRARLSITDAANPAPATAIPAPVAQILKVEPTLRSAQQRRTLALHVVRDRNERELAQLPPPQMVYAATSGFSAIGNFKPAGRPREVSVLRRGDIHSPIGPAMAGSLSSVAGLPSRFELANADDEGARRAALARWINHRDNVLTWRSIVNRIWHYHFGRGIVDTPNDLGRMGGKPTHPELLDWLAVSFRDDMQGSLKQLHKLIVTSNVYMQSTRHEERYAAIDADNRLLWRMNSLRLDAEQVRDSMLAISGRLDLTMHGPSVKQFVERPGVHVTPVVDYAALDVDHPSQYRRSVYRFVFRTLPDPLMDALDCPDLSQLSPRRSVSVTAQQALEMLNNRFMVRQCEHIAARVQKETAGLEQGTDAVIHRQVARVYALLFGRSATENELAAVSDYAGKHGLANAVRVLVNSNEFLFLN